MSGSHTNERCTYRESCKSGKSDTGLFCLFGMMPEFLPLKTEILKFHTVLFLVYFVSVRSLGSCLQISFSFYTLEFQPFVRV